MSTSWPLGKLEFNVNESGKPLILTTPLCLDAAEIHTLYASIDV